MTTRVLFFCMGNICRSPTAEGVFRHVIDQAELINAIDIDSAGTHDYLRYLKFISSIATPHVGVEKLHKLAETRTENQHRHKGFNLFSEEDTYLFRTLLQGEFFITGFTNQQLRHYLADQSASQVTRLLKRLRVHGIIKKVGKRYKYYLTDFGREAASMALKLREMVVIPQLAFAPLS